MGLERREHPEQPTVSSNKDIYRSLLLLLCVISKSATLLQSPLVYMEFLNYGRGNYCFSCKISRSPRRACVAMV